MCSSLHQRAFGISIWNKSVAVVFVFTLFERLEATRALIFTIFRFGHFWYTGMNDDDEKQKPISTFFYRNSATKSGKSKSIFSLHLKLNENWNIWKKKKNEFYCLAWKFKWAIFSVLQPLCIVHNFSLIILQICKMQ